MRFFILAIVFFVSSCDLIESKEDLEPVPTILMEKVIEKYPDGSVKAIEEFETLEGAQKLYGYKEFYPSGKVKIEGRYNDGKKRDGLWQAYFENGNNWSIGTYIDGKENGEKKVWYENGKVRYTGQMKEGKPIGEWNVWDEKGNVTTKMYE